jgi:hypothetical protein
MELAIKGNAVGEPAAKAEVEEVRVIGTIRVLQAALVGFAVLHAVVLA